MKILHLSFFCMSLSLDMNLLDDNFRSHVAGIKLQKLTDLGYETFLHPSYSPDLSPTDYYF